MNVKQEFLKLAGLTESANVVEAEEKAAVDFAKNSPEVATVKLAVRKAVRQCEKDASEVKSPNLRKTYERDAEDYDSILGLVASGRQAAAAKAWAHMDTACRDVVFEVTTDKEARKIIAAYFGTTLLREGDDDADENDVAVDKDIEQLKKDVAQIKKDQEKDDADEGTKDANDTTVTAKIKKVESAVKELAAAQEKDNEEESDEEEEGDEGMQEAKNHMGDREYQSYGSWKAACKKAHPGCSFRGDIDIGACVVDGKDVGEWDGAVGSVYAAQTVKESADKEAELKAEVAKFKEMEEDLSSMMSAARTEKENDAVDDMRYEVAKQKRLVDRLKNSVKLGKAAKDSGVKESVDDYSSMSESKYFSYEYSWEDKSDDTQEHFEKGVIKAPSNEEAEAKVKTLHDRMISVSVKEISKDQFEKLDESEIKVVDFGDAVKDEKEEKVETAKIPAAVTKSLKDKIKELEAEIKYTSHLPSQEQEIINMNGAIQVMANILELMDKGCEYSMKKIGILLTSLEGPQKVLIPKEVWKFMSFDYANPVSKSNLMDKFREVKAHATKTKD